MQINYFISKRLERDRQKDNSIYQAIDRAIIQFESGNYGDILESDLKGNNESLLSNSGRVFGRYQTPKEDILIILDIYPKGTKYGDNVAEILYLSEV